MSFKIIPKKVFHLPGLGRFAVRSIGLALIFGCGAPPFSHGLLAQELYVKEYIYFNSRLLAAERQVLTQYARQPLSPHGVDGASSANAFAQEEGPLPEGIEDAMVVPLNGPPARLVNMKQEANPCVRPPTTDAATRGEAQVEARWQLSPYLAITGLKEREVKNHE